MSLPVVSVLMPVYNGARYLAAAIDSIRTQSLEDFELIIVDDGSDDDTPIILRAYADRDARVRILRQDHQGLTRSLNTGLRQLRGEFVARMDADDVACPDRFLRQVEFLRAHLDHVAVGSCVYWIDAAGEPLGPEYWPLTNDEIEQRLGRGHGGLPHPTLMARRAALMRLGGYRERFTVAQDKDLWLRLLEIGKLANLPTILLYYRQHAESISSRQVELQWRMTCEAIEDACHRRHRPVPTRLRSKKPRPRGPEHLYRSWSKRARRSGLDRIARKYARKAIASAPWQPANWWQALLAYAQSLVKPLAAGVGMPLAHKAVEFEYDVATRVDLTSVVAPQTPYDHARQVAATGTTVGPTRANLPGPSTASRRVGH